MRSIKRILTFCALALIISSPCYAQWAMTYGGENGDEASSICLTDDGGYIFAGNTSSFLIDPGAEALVIKVNSEGQIVWEKTYGGSANHIRRTTDGGYIVVGRAYGDIWLLKLDSIGNIEWQKTYGESDNEWDPNVQQTTDGGFILLGTTTSVDWDYLVVKLDSDGDIMWQKTYGGSGYERARSIQQTKDGGFVVAGFGSFFDVGANMWVLKLDSEGEILWQKTYGHIWYEAPYIQQTSDKGYILAAHTSSFGAGRMDIWILKLNSDGTISWQKTFGGSDNESVTSIQQTSDEGYIVSGVTDSFVTCICEECYGDAWILRLNSDGDIIWQKTYGGHHRDVVNSVIETNEGNYVLAGFTESFGSGYTDVWVLKVNENGQIPPYCDAIGLSQAIFSDTYVVPQDTSVYPNPSSVTSEITDFSSLDTSAETLLLCPSRITCEPILDIHPDIFEVQVVGVKDPKEPVGEFLNAFIEMPEGFIVDSSTVTLSIQGHPLALAEVSMVEDNLLRAVFPLDLNNIETILGLKVVKVVVMKEKIRVKVITAPTQPLDLIKLMVSGNLSDDEGKFRANDTVRMILKE